MAVEMLVVWVWAGIVLMKGRRSFDEGSQTWGAGVTTAIVPELSSRVINLWIAGNAGTMVLVWLIRMM